MRHRHHDVGTKARDFLLDRTIELSVEILPRPSCQPPAKPARPQMRIRPAAGAIKTTTELQSFDRNALDDWLRAVTGATPNS